MPSQMAPLRPAMSLIGTLRAGAHRTGQPCATLETQLTSGSYFDAPIPETHCQRNSEDNLLTCLAQADTMHHGHVSE